MTTASYEGYGGLIGPAEPRSEAAELESPFVAEFYSQEEERDVGLLPAPQAGFETPFRAEYYGETEPASREATALGEALTLLQDAEFAEALAELAAEAAAQHSEHEAQLGTSGNAALVGERLLSEWMDPLQRRAEQLLEAMAEATRTTEVSTLNEAEVDRLFEHLDPEAAAPAPLSELGMTPASLAETPAAEQFLGRLFKKATSLVKGAVSLAKKGLSAVSRVLPVGALLDKLKGLVRPLLQRVLTMALDKLPADLQPIARKLSGRFLGATGLGELEDESPFGIPREAAWDGAGRGAAAGESYGEFSGELLDEMELDEAPPQVHVLASPATRTLADEFDALAAELLLAADEQEQQLLVEEAAVAAAGPGLLGAELQEARSDFISSMAALPAGGDPGPMVQRFIPAITAVLPIVRTGLSLVGRGRVVGMLAGLLADLIRPIAGPNTERLSQAIADAGLRLLTLEAPSAEQARLAGPAALAAVVEETVHGVAALPTAEQEDPAGLQAATRQLFFESLSRHVPTTLLKPTLASPETSDSAGVWVLRPQPAKSWYKKFTRVFPVSLTEPAARAIRTFGGVPLDAALRDTRGSVSFPLRARVHLYEAIPGTWLSRISALEAVPGLRGRSKRAWSQLHPLTVEAAGLLIGQPGLGKATPARFLEDRDRVGVGQRFYYLELERSQGAHGVCSASSDVYVTIDLRPGRDQVRVAVYLSEADAAAVATELAADRHGQAVRLLMRSAERGLRHALASGVSERVQVLREGAPVMPGEDFVQGAAGKWLLEQAGKALLSWVLKKLLDHLWRAVTSWAQQRKHELIAAARDPRCGVTIVFGFTGSPVLAAVRMQLSGRVPTPSDLVTLARGGNVLPTVITVAGRHRARQGMPGGDRAAAPSGRTAP